MSDNPNYPISTCACSWFDKNGTLEIHVFSCDGYTITERYTAGSGWTTGSTFQGSDASVTTWADSAGQHVRLYVTNADTTSEWCWDPGVENWTPGQYTQP